DFDVNFVRRHLDERIALRYELADLLAPCDDGALRDGLAHLGERNSDHRVRQKLFLRLPLIRALNQDCPVWPFGCNPPGRRPQKYLAGSAGKTTVRGPAKRGRAWLSTKAETS